MGHEAARDHVDRRVRDLGTPRYDLGLLAAREADTVHLLGGGYINAIWPHHGLLPRLALALREIAGARVVATGLGLMPVDEDADVVSALSSFDHVSLRDAPSAQLMGRETGLSDAFLGLDRLPAFRAGGYTADAADADVWVCLQSDLTTPEVFDAAVEQVRDPAAVPWLPQRPRALRGVPSRGRPDRLRPLGRPDRRGGLPAVRGRVAARHPLRAGPAVDHLALPPPPDRRRVRCTGDGAADERLLPGEARVARRARHRLVGHVARRSRSCRNRPGHCPTARRPRGCTSASRRRPTRSTLAEARRGSRRSCSPAGAPVERACGHRPAGDGPRRS